MTNPSLFLGFLLLLVGSLLGNVSSKSVADTCGAEVQKVAPCLPFATGSQEAPLPACCSDVGEMRSSEPVCLCFIIQQAANGKASIKDIKVPRLLQLPSACKLANTSVAECPTLLGLAPNSPDAAIFAANSTTSSTPAANSTTPSTGSAAPPSSGGLMRAPQLIGNVVTAVVVAVFLSMFSG